GLYDGREGGDVDAAATSHRRVPGLGLRRRRPELLQARLATEILLAVVFRCVVRELTARPAEGTLADTADRGPDRLRDARLALQRGLSGRNGSRVVAPKWRAGDRHGDARGKQQTSTESQDPESRHPSLLLSMPVVRPGCQRRSASTMLLVGPPC